MFLSIKFGILFGLGVLLLARFFRHKLYVSRSKYMCMDFCEFPLLSIIKPS